MANIVQFLILIICLNVAVNCVEFYREKPSFLPSCRIKDPDFVKCSTNSVQKLIDELNKGIPEITATFGPLDPMNVPDMGFKQDTNEVVTISSNLSMVSISGFSHMKIKQNKVNPKDFTWETKMYVPKMRLDSNYNLMGKFLLIPISGSGKMFVELENLNIIMYTKGKLYEREGFTFHNVTNVRALLNMTRVRSHMSNLFNGQSDEVGEITNEFFNTNWRELYEAVRPMIEKTVEDIMYRLFSQLFRLIPANFLVEDIPTSEQLYEKKQK